MSGHIKHFEFVGSSLKDLRAMPEKVKVTFGVALYQAQQGIEPEIAVKMKGLSGIVELKETAEDGTYRAMYTAKFDNVIFLLHAFKKKSKKGIATPKQEIDLIKSRLKDAKQIYEYKYK